MKKIYVILLGALFLLFHGLFNKFPLIYPDTGTYLYSGFEVFAPSDRPVFYGLLIRHLSLYESPWFIIYGQAIIVSYILYLFFETYSSSPEKINSRFLIFTAFASFCSSLSYFVSYVIPDIFTSVSFVCLLLLLKYNHLKLYNKIVTIAVFAVSIATHSSHYLIFFIYIAILLPITHFKIFKFEYKNIMLSAGILATTCISIVGFNYVLTKEAFISRGGHVFMMARFNEWGILKQYLDENCESKNYKICPYKDNIPIFFIWNFNESPLYKTGGWEANKEEYNNIIWDIATTPKYLKKICIRSAESTLKLFFNFEHEFVTPQNHESPAYLAMVKHLNLYSREYMGSKVMNNSYNEKIFSTIQYVFLFIFLFYYLTQINTNKYLTQLLLLVLVILAVNAFICGTFSDIVPRYQSRVIWLFFLPFFIDENINKLLDKLKFNNT